MMQLLDLPQKRVPPSSKGNMMIRAIQVKRNKRHEEDISFKSYHLLNLQMKIMRR